MNKATEAFKNCKGRDDNPPPKESIREILSCKLLFLVTDPIYGNQ